MAFVRTYLMNSLNTMKHSKHILKFNKKHLFTRDPTHKRHTQLHAKKWKQKGTHSALHLHLESHRMCVSMCTKLCYYFFNRSCWIYIFAIVCVSMGPIQYAFMPDFIGIVILKKKKVY